jgi:hypothetical protein
MMNSQNVQERLLIVIPAEAGTQIFKWLRERWTPAFAGVTTFCEFINNNS